MLRLCGLSYLSVSFTKLFLQMMNKQGGGDTENIIKSIKQGGNKNINLRSIFLIASILILSIQVSIQIPIFLILIVLILISIL